MFLRIELPKNSSHLLFSIKESWVNAISIVLSRYQKNTNKEGRNSVTTRVIERENQKWVTAHMETWKQTQNHQLTPSQILWWFQLGFVHSLAFSKETKKLLEDLEMRHMDIDQIPRDFVSLFYTKFILIL